MGVILTQNVLAILFMQMTLFYLHPPQMHFRNWLMYVLIMSIGNELLFNVKKTKCMSPLPPCMKGITVPKFYINKMCVSIVSQECYLGFMVTDDYKEDEAISKEIRSLYSRGNAIIRKFKKCTQDVKKQLFLSYCNSFYCCSIWSNFKKSSLKRLHVAHNNIFRVLFNVQRDLSVSQCFVTHNVPNFLVIRRKLVFSMYKRVFSSPNELVSTISQMVHFQNSQLYNQWNTVLYNK